MLRYATLVRNEREFLSMTGVTVQEFVELVPVFQASFERHMAEWNMDGTPRVGRVYRQYQTCPLPTTEDKLLFVLVFLRKATDQTLHGQLFGLSQSNTNKWLHLLLAVLDQTVAQLGERPARSAAELARRLHSEQGAAAGRFFHDGTDRPIRRPSDASGQKDFYSGKKKHHSVKNIILIDTSSKMLYLSDTHEGAAHEKSIVDADPYELPPGSILYQDSGFQGLELAGVELRQPTKQPRGGELSPEQKAANRHLAQIRVQVEPVIGGVKRFRIVKDTLRLWRDDACDRVMVVCCALHNFILNYRPWCYRSP